MNMAIDIFKETWYLLQDSSVYILFGLLISGLLRVFLNPASVARHFGRGRFRSVFKASLLGIPIPLCSCGVLPAAAALKKQGANNGAVTSFLISTPESGVDSIAITYALLDPIMTVIRPVVAFTTATLAGILENSLSYKRPSAPSVPDISCPVDGCCDGLNCLPEEHRRHHSFVEKSVAGIRFAFTELWQDLAGWFFVGMLLAGAISAFLPVDALTEYMGGGMLAMMLMLAAGIPLYICATASTPIAAALILKGVSPGAALVFLIAGPATNITALTVLLGILGKRATMIYLVVISISAVVFGLVTDQIYLMLGISAEAVAGKASEIIPQWAQWIATVVLLLISVKPLIKSVSGRFHSDGASHEHTHHQPHKTRPDQNPELSDPTGST